MHRLSEQPSVLHVDDDRDLAESTAAALAGESNRLHVEHATSVTEGLDRLEDETFDCIVSGYDMQGRDGIEFLESVRADYPDLSFILYTDTGSEAVASEAISAGVTDCLPKGTGADQSSVLASRVLDAAEQHCSRTELEASQQCLSLFFDHSPLGVIEWDAEHRLVRMNDAAESILGYTSRSWSASPGSCSSPSPTARRSKPSSRTSAKTPAGITASTTTSGKTGARSPAGGTTAS